MYVVRGVTSWRRGMRTRYAPTPFRVASRGTCGRLEQARRQAVPPDFEVRGAGWVKAGWTSRRSSRHRRPPGSPAAACSTSPRTASQHALDRPFAERQLPRDLAGVEAVGHQPEHLDLAVAQTREPQPAGREHLPLQPPHLPEQAGEQVSGHLRAAVAGLEDHRHEPLRRDLRPAHQRRHARLRGGDDGGVVERTGDQHGAGDAAAADGPQHPQHLLVDALGDDDGDLGLVELRGVDDVDLGARAQLAGHTGLGDRVVRVDEDLRPLRPWWIRSGTARSTVMAYPSSRTRSPAGRRRRRVCRQCFAAASRLLNVRSTRLPAFGLRSDGRRIQRVHRHRSGAERLRQSGQAVEVAQAGRQPEAVRARPVLR